MRSVFANNIPNVTKFSKAQLSEIIWSGRFLGVLLGKLGGPLMRVGVSLAKTFLPLFVTMASASTIYGAMCGKGVVRAGKGTALVISNEDMVDIIRIIKSLEDSGILIDGVSEA